MFTRLRFLLLCALLATPATAQEVTVTSKIILGGATVTNPSGANVSIGSGTLTAGTFSGSCASCTSIPAGNLTGTITSSVQDSITRLGTIASGGDYAKDFLPDVTSTRNIGSATKLWNQGFVSQLNATLFAKATQTLYGGWLSVSKNAGTFAAAVASGDTTIDFGQAMTANQFVLVRAADTGGTITEEYFKVVSLSSGTVYNVTRNLSGLGAKNWAKGTPYQVRGVAGDGWLELNAFDTPRMSIFAQGSAYNNSTEQIRIGYLTGMPNSSSGIGVYMGDASNYVRWDGTNLGINAGNIVITNSGLTVGNAASSYTPNGAVNFKLATGHTGTLSVYNTESSSAQDESLLAIDNNLTAVTGIVPVNATVRLKAIGYDRFSSHQSHTASVEARSTSDGSGGEASTVTLTADTVSVVGAMAPVPWTTGTIALANGRNDNVATGGVSFIKAITGPTAAFAISGIAGGSDGQILTILHNTGQVLTINHADVNSTAANRIYNPGSVNLATAATFGTVTLQYDALIPGWILLSIK